MDVQTGNGDVRGRVVVVDSDMNACPDGTTGALVADFEIADLDPLLVLNEEGVFDFAGAVDSRQRAFAVAVDDDGRPG